MYRDRAMVKPYYEDKYITIYHGDCRELLADMPRVDLVLTDPPYGIGVNSKHNVTRRISKHNKGYHKYDYPARKYFNDAWDIAIEQSMFDRLITFAPKAIVWGGNYYVTPRSKCWLVWDKCSLNDNADAELAFTTLPGAIRKFTYLWNGYWQEPGYKRQVREHLTEKPIPLMKWCIGLAKDVTSLIDPYMGSGTTLRAAKDLGVKAIGIEIEERYCEVAARRMAQGALEFEPVQEPEQMSIAL
jgi:DNA modification methylase